MAETRFSHCIKKTHRDKGTTGSQPRLLQFCYNTIFPCQWGPQSLPRQASQHLRELSQQNLFRTVDQTQADDQLPPYLDAKRESSSPTLNTQSFYSSNSVLILSNFFIQQVLQIKPHWTASTNLASTIKNHPKWLHLDWIDQNKPSYCPRAIIS